MDANLTSAEPESLAALHEQDARALRVMLLELAEEGAAMARLYVEKAKDQAYDGKPGTGPSPDCAESYCDVARSIRQTVMLVQKLTAPAPAPQAVRPAQDPAEIRKQIIRRVEDAIHKDAPAEGAERLRAEFLERMETPEFGDAMSQRPVQEIVNEIRADLGIHGPGSLEFYKRRTPADIAVLCARAAISGGGVTGWWNAKAHRTTPDAPPIRGP
jgi:putative component of toxin-antitoxin plasmid stabilization module